MDEVETKLCPNCQRAVNVSNFVIHEMHCHRHISLCPVCKEPIPKAEMDVHHEENHAEIQCSKCEEQVAKDQYEKHENELCKKRNVKCRFCEMDTAFQDLKDHEEYCGTRTEPCPLCGQFIMIKHLDKHERSNCSFPAVKETNGVKKNNNNVPAFSRNGEEVHVDPFTFDEITRLLNKPAEIQEISAPRRKSKNPSQASNFTFDEDEDRLLAYQLAQDLGPESNTFGLNDFHDNAFSRREGGAHDLGLRDVGSEEDVSLLPCEFCNEVFPLASLQHHQSICLAEQNSALFASAGASSPPLDVPNNRSYGIASEPRQPPPIINNLLTDEDFQRQGSPTGSSPDDFLLPCEFCEDLFPHDVLVQHQAVCDHSRAITPLPSTPAVRPTKKRPNVDIPGVTRKDNIRRPAPDISTILSQKPANTAMRRHSGQYSDMFTPKQQMNSTLEKYGVAPDDSYTERAQRRAMRMQEHIEESPRPRTGKSHKGQMTQMTLNSLLDDSNFTERPVVNKNKNSVSKKMPRGKPSVPNCTSDYIPSNSQNRLTGGSGSTPYTSSRTGSAHRPVAHGSRSTGVTARDVQNKLQSEISVTGARRARRPEPTSSASSRRQPNIFSFNSESSNSRTRNRSDL